MIDIHFFHLVKRLLSEDKSVKTLPFPLNQDPTVSDNASNFYQKATDELLDIMYKSVSLASEEGNESLLFPCLLDIMEHIILINKSSLDVVTGVFTLLLGCDNECASSDSGSYQMEVESGVNDIGDSSRSTKRKSAQSRKSELQSKKDHEKNSSCDNKVSPVRKSIISSLWRRVRGLIHISTLLDLIIFSHTKATAGVRKWGEMPWMMDVTYILGRAKEILSNFLLTEHTISNLSHEGFMLLQQIIHVFQKCEVVAPLVSKDDAQYLDQLSTKLDTCIRTRKLKLSKVQSVIFTSLPLMLPSSFLPLPMNKSISSSLLQEVNSLSDKRLWKTLERLNLHPQSHMSNAFSKKQRGHKRKLNSCNENSSFVVTPCKVITAMKEIILDINYMNDSIFTDFYQDITGSLQIIISMKPTMVQDLMQEMVNVVVELSEAIDLDNTSDCALPRAKYMASVVVSCWLCSESLRHCCCNCNDDEMELPILSIIRDSLSIITWLLNKSSIILSKNNIDYAESCRTLDCCFVEILRQNTVLCITELLGNHSIHDNVQRIMLDQLTSQLREPVCRVVGLESSSMNGTEFFPPIHAADNLADLYKVPGKMSVHQLFLGCCKLPNQAMAAFCWASCLANWMVSHNFALCEIQSKIDCYVTVLFATSGIDKSFVMKILHVVLVICVQVYWKDEFGTRGIEILEILLYFINAVDNADGSTAVTFFLNNIFNVEATASSLLEKPSHGWRHIAFSVAQCGLRYPSSVLAALLLIVVARERSANYGRHVHSQNSNRLKMVVIFCSLI